MCYLVKRYPQKKKKLENFLKKVHWYLKTRRWMGKSSIKKLKKIKIYKTTLNKVKNFFLFMA